jgi:hypothetical protein
MPAWAALSVSVLPAFLSVFQPAFVRQLSVLSAVPVDFRVQPAWLSASVALPLSFQLHEFQPFYLLPVLSEQSQPSDFQRLIGFLLP